MLYPHFQLTTSQGGRQNSESGFLPLDIFQLTTSQGGRQPLADATMKRIAFHLTTSQGGRHEPCLCVVLFDILSTHDLTRRSTPGRDIRGSPPDPFNSRPHKEVDKSVTPDLSAGDSFNSRPHKEVDYISVCIFHKIDVFQLTTSQGGRRRNPLLPRISPVFQLTTSQGGRRSLSRMYRKP